MPTVHKRTRAQAAVPEAEVDVEDGLMPAPPPGKVRRSSLSVLASASLCLSVSMSLVPASLYLSLSLPDLLGDANLSEMKETCVQNTATQFPSPLVDFLKWKIGQQTIPRNIGSQRDTRRYRLTV